MTYNIEKRVMDDCDKTIIKEFDKWMGPKTATVHRLIEGEFTVTPSHLHIDRVSRG